MRRNAACLEHLLRFVPVTLLRPLAHDAVELILVHEPPLNCREAFVRDEFASAQHLAQRPPLFIIADGDSDPATGITAADITVVDGPDGGEASGIDISVSGFDPSTNIVTFRLQSGETLQAGALFTVQYLNQENLTVPATSLVTQERLFLEAMEDILPGINKIIVSPEAETILILGGQGGIVPVPVGPAAP